MYWQSRRRSANSVSGRIGWQQQQAFPVSYGYGRVDTFRWFRKREQQGVLIIFGPWL